MKRIFILFILLSAVLLMSCASIQHSRDERTIQKFSKLINTGNSVELYKISRLPFLLDQEIILLDRDIDTFWTNIIHAGYKMDEPELEKVIPVSDSSYLEFYDSMEVRAFFDKYLGKNPRLLELKTINGQKILLLLDKKFCTVHIRGFKGPY